MIGIDYSSIEYNNKDKYKLSSIITEGNLLFALTRFTDNKIIKLKEISNLKENFFLDSDYIFDLFQKNELFHKNILEITIAFLAKEFSIVPKKMISENIKHHNSLLHSVKQYLDDYSIQKSNIDSIDAYNFFPFPNALKKIVSDNYHKANIYHANDLLVCQANKSINTKDFILVNFHEYILQTVVYRAGEFVQSNIYNIKSKDDILYYILLNLKNTGIPLNKANVYLSGRVEKESSIYKLLFEHIKNLHFMDNLDRTDFSNVFLGKPKHLFFDIYSLSKCV